MLRADCSKPGVLQAMLMVAGLLTLLFAVCATAAESSESGKDGAAAVVHMTNQLSYSPARITIQAGEAVEWVNESTVAHTVTADAAKADKPGDVHLPAGVAPFGSGIVSPGQTYRHVFEEPGHYRYFCIPHEFAGMVGEVEVLSADENASAAAKSTDEDSARTARSPSLPFVLGAHQPPRPPHYREATGAARVLYWLGDFHPAATDVTVGAILLAFLSEILLLITRRQSFRAVTRYCVWVGGLAAFGTAFLGWCFAGVHIFHPLSILTVHRTLGTLTGLWGLVLIVVAEIARSRGTARWRWTFRVVLLAAALLVAATGFFGGSMIYGIDHYAWPGA